MKSRKKSINVKTKKKFNSKQQVRKKLGKVLNLSDDCKSGVFLSPTRGLVEYKVVSGSFYFVEKDDPSVDGILKDGSRIRCDSFI